MIVAVASEKRTSKPANQRTSELDGRESEQSARRERSTARDELHDDDDDDDVEGSRRKAAGDRRQAAGSRQQTPSEGGAVDPEAWTACGRERGRGRSGQPGCDETADGSAARVASSSACNLEGLGGGREEGRRGGGG